MSRFRLWYQSQRLRACYLKPNASMGNLVFYQLIFSQKDEGHSGDHYERTRLCMYGELLVTFHFGHEQQYSLIADFRS